ADRRATRRRPGSGRAAAGGRRPARRPRSGRPRVGISPVAWHPLTVRPTVYPPGRKNATRRGTAPGGWRQADGSNSPPRHTLQREEQAQAARLRPELGRPGRARRTEADRKIVAGQLVDAAHGPTVPRPDLDDDVDVLRGPGRVEGVVARDGHDDG